MVNNSIEYAMAKYLQVQKYVRKAAHDTDPLKKNQNYEEIMKFARKYEKKHKQENSIY